MKDINRYKFRGQNALKQWHVGYLIVKDKACYIRHHGVENYVYKESIGQAIGKKDVNGEDIFEGDIVDIRGMQYVIQWVPALFSFRMVSLSSEITFPITSLTRMKVVGNVFDEK